MNVWATNRAVIICNKGGVQDGVKGGAKLVLYE
jgi:hypothetical protein